MVEVSLRSVAAPERLRLLDGLRLAAAVSVLLFHWTARASTAWGKPPSQVFPHLSVVTAYGGLGVQLFFIISGAVVLMSAWGRSTSAFVASRVARLYPAYWFAVLTTGALLAVAHPVLPDVDWNQIGPRGLLVNLTMFQQPFRVPHVDGVYWTLWEEMKFYFVVLLLSAVGITARRVYWVAVVWPAVAALQLVVDVPVVGALLNVNTASYFAVGMLLHLGHRTGFTRAVVLALLLNGVFVWISITTFVVPLFDRYTPAPLDPFLVLALCVLMVAAVLAAMVSPLAGVDWRWLSTAGALTYPLYLLHDDWGMWLIGLLHGALPPAVLVGLLLAGFCGVAWLVHRTIERTFGPPLRSGLLRLLQPVETRLREARRTAARDRVV